MNTLDGYFFSRLIFAVRLLGISCCLLVQGCFFSHHVRTPATQTFGATPRQACIEGKQIVHFDKPLMGTNVHFTVWAEDTSFVHQAMQKAWASMHQVEILMTTYDHPDWPPSDVRRINAHAGEHPVVIDAQTFDVLQRAQQVAMLSDGLFDVTIGALDPLWNFDDPNAFVQPPTQQAIFRHRNLVNFRDLILDPKAHTAFLRRRHMAINLGGIAKGYAVDQAVNVLKDHGLCHAIVQAGGDTFAAGGHDHAPWRLAIRDPRGILAEDTCGVLQLQDKAASTAGDYERKHESDAGFFHHILDPRTGRPGEKSRSVTIIAPNAWLADALDDVVFLMGPEQGLVWLQRFSDTEAIVIDAKGQQHVSSGLQDPNVWQPHQTPLPAS